MQIVALIQRYHCTIINFHQLKCAHDLHYFSLAHTQSCCHNSINEYVRVCMYVCMYHSAGGRTTRVIQLTNDKCQDITVAHALSTHRPFIIKVRLCHISQRTTRRLFIYITICPLSCRQSTLLKHSTPLIPYALQQQLQMCIHTYVCMCVHK